MRVGAAVGAGDPLGDLERVGMDVVQLNLSAPRNWAAPKPRDYDDELRDRGVVAAAHAVYLCNPASADPAVRDTSWTSLQQTCDAAARIDAGAVVVHAGQAGADGTVHEACERWLEGIDELSTDVPLLIENTASGNAAPGRRLDDWVTLVAALREAAPQLPIGVCLDTCHAFAGDPAAAEDPGGWVTEVRERVGGIDLLHVNDSRDPAGSGRDRHATLGEGEMGLEALGAMIDAAQAPVALVETPAGDDDDARRAELAVLRSHG